MSRFNKIIESVLNTGKSFKVDTMSGTDKDNLVEILKKDRIKFKDLGGGIVQIYLDRKSAAASVLLSYLKKQKINFKFYPPGY
jgi:hypothetical protein